MSLPQEIDVEDLDRMTKDGVPHRILDVREPWEVAVCGFKDSLHIPMRELPAHLERLPANENLVVICHHGVRSLHVMAWLRNMGFRQATSLRGGIDAWAKRVDPSMNTY
ncbi:MAG: rhodanese-like domain-containing protein [Magnetospirillum sp. WYHS-4]